ncbi:hypothetical protein BC826DRAFT_970638 [Russula brevipes]|nr:hypothetical protein BC826DRAFT_970638 [Russula brevipes]
MKLFAIASVFALSAILVSGSAIHLHRRGPPSICGEGSELLDETSVSHGGKTILVSTSTCPPTKRDTTVSKRSAINIDKRQNICTDGSGKLTLGAGKIQTWTSGTCAVGVANSDTVSYTICYETIAYDAALAADNCLGTTGAGGCGGTGASGDRWAIALVCQNIVVLC